MADLTDTIETRAGYGSNIPAGNMAGSSKMMRASLEAEEGVPTGYRNPTDQGCRDAIRRALAGLRLRVDSRHSREVFESQSAG